MVDVGGKAATRRLARAAGRIALSPPAYTALREGKTAKGDVLAVARIAGIMAAKRTCDLIPLCHGVQLSSVRVAFHWYDEQRQVEAECTAECTGQTGVEMEALTGASVALLAIYDMCKALDQGMTIGNVRLLEKRGGRHGAYIREESGA